MLGALQRNPEKSYTLSLVTNESDESDEVIEARMLPGKSNSVNTGLGLKWPYGVYSLTHVALPFPPDDPLYGQTGKTESPGIHLGDIAMRGERGVLHISPSEMLRLRWNPFYTYLENKVLEFFELK